MELLHLGTAAKFLMAALPALGHELRTSDFYIRSTKAAFNSVFCFDPVVLMEDTAGRCVIHIYQLLV